MIQYLRALIKPADYLQAAFSFHSFRCLLAARLLQPTNAAATPLLAEESRILTNLTELQAKTSAASLSITATETMIQMREELERVWQALAHISPIYVSLRRADLFDYQMLQGVLQ